MLNRTGPRFHVLLSSQMFGLYSDGLARLEQIGCAIRRRPSATEREFADAVREADVWIVGLQRVTEAIIRESRRLRVVGVHGVGVDHVDVTAATRLGMAVLNTPGANARAVAELTMGFIFALSRDMVRADQLVRSGQWDPTMVGEEIGGKTLGLVGFGAIGAAVAALARAIGMQVLAWRRSGPPDGAVPGVSFVPMDDLLRRSDYVSVHTALTDATRGLLGERELGLMKPTACLVNTARGRIVDEAALHRALAAGRLRGAALDVFGAEPPEGPLVGLPRVITTSHIGGNTAESFARTTDGLTESLLALLRGERPAGLVNPEVWPAYVRRWGASTIC